VRDDGLTTPGAKLDEIIPQLMHEAGVPGLTVAIIRDAAVVWSGAFGVSSAADSVPVSDDTIFEAASLSKPVFAYGVLKLYERGILELDRPLVDYLPAPYSDFAPLRTSMHNPADARLQRVTARHILSHSAGFGNWGAGTIGRLHFEPGERFAYAGEGYMFLQRVVEHLTGEPLAPYLGAAVLAPLEMNDSSFTWQEWYADRVAQGHGERSKSVGRNWSEAFSAYSLFTTALDYARFVVESMRTVRGGCELLAPPTLREMVTPVVRVSDALSWGLGWGIDRTPVGDYFWQWGDLGDFHNFALGSRERRDGLTVFSNSERGLSIFGTLIRAALGAELPTLADPTGPIYT
jgi:CubicO group peptidase (beta-lactamase class C family)